MKVQMDNGFYKFWPENPPELTLLKYQAGLELVRVGDYYTFAFLAALPRYSISGVLYGNLPATATYEGAPEQVLKKNGFVYGLESGRLVPAADIIGEVVVYQSADGCLQTLCLPQAGAYIENKKLAGFAGYFGFNNVKIILERVNYEND